MSTSADAKEWVFGVVAEWKWKSEGQSIEGTYGCLYAVGFPRRHFSSGREISIALAMTDALGFVGENSINSYGVCDIFTPSARNPLSICRLRFVSVPAKERT